MPGHPPVVAVINGHKVYSPMMRHVVEMLQERDLTFAQARASVEQRGFGKLNGGAYGSARRIAGRTLPQTRPLRPVSVGGSSVLSKPIETLLTTLPSRTHNALRANGLRCLADLVVKSPRELRRLQGIGTTAVEQIQQVLRRRGLGLDCVIGYPQAVALTGQTVNVVKQAVTDKRITSRKVGSHILFDRAELIAKGPALRQRHPADAERPVRDRRQAAPVTARQAALFAEPPATPAAAAPVTAPVPAPAPVTAPVTPPVTPVTALVPTPSRNGAANGANGVHHTQPAPLPVFDHADAVATQFVDEWCEKVPRKVRYSAGQQLQREIAAALRRSIAPGPPATGAPDVALWNKPPEN